MRTNLLIALHLLALTAPDALAGNTQRPPRGQQQQQPEQDATKLCEQKPLQGIAAPKKPTNHDAVDVTAEIPDGAENQLKFDQHCTKGGGRVDGCDITLARAYLSYHRAKRAFEGELKKVCEDIKTKVPECQKQSEAIKCTGDIYRHVAAEFNKVKARLDKDADRLTLDHRIHHGAAKKIVKPDQPGARSTITDAGKLRKAAKLVSTTGEAYTGEAPIRATNTEAHTRTCMGQVGNQDFCSHVTAAADAKYYRVTLANASQITERSAARYTELANRTQGPGGDQTGDNKKNGGLLDSVGGLDGLMKMATLGMMGAGMYCQMSGQCGNQPSQGLPADAAGNTGLGATSPTPSSANNGPQQSPLEETDSKGGSATPPTADFKTHTDTDTSPSFAGPGGSGFSSELDNDALQPFQGDLNRAPASAAAPSGGGLGGGNDSSGASAPPTGELNADAGKGGTFDGGIGPIGGGGGLPAAGGFSLSSSPDAPAADSALKNILNGEMPADAGLAGLGDDLGATGSPSEQGDIDLQGTESLFFRVRDTHVRCVKRGCVGREVGEKI